MGVYVHRELNDGLVSVQKVPYQGREVLVRSHKGDRRIRSNVNVVGFIEGEYMEPREGNSLPLTRIIPITDEKQKIELSNLLRQMGEERLIEFWPD